MQSTRFGCAGICQWLGHALICSMMYARYRLSAFPFRLELFRRMQTSKPLSIFITLDHICYSLLPHPVWLGKFISRPQCVIHATNDLLLSHNGKPSTTLQLIFAAGFAGALGGILGNSSGTFVCGSIKYRLDAKPFLSDLVREPGEQYNCPDAVKAFSGVKIFEV